MQTHVQRCAGIGGWLHSTIGRKQLIGVTGLGLSLFLLTHMAGNMLILAGPEAYNKYSYALITNPLLPIAQGGLILAFLAHLFLALRLQLLNWGARDTRYAVMSNGAKGTSMVQRSLWAQGLLILVFVILHLATFKYGTHYTATYDGVEMRDLHKLVIEVFNEPGYVVWYVVALIVLGLHIGHGVASSFQTLGFNHPRYVKPIKAFSVFYALVVIGGFLSQPIYVFFIRG
jgi:succinate dehydrogenase / fumarate reductase, cytochrome b subunit